MTDPIALTGLVATEPRHLTTGDDLDVTSFRLASTQRKFDRTEQRWVDGETNWYTVATFRQLAVNVASCIEKGHRVVVTGRLRVRDWTNGEKNGTTVEVDADAVGPDLAWGTASYSRSAPGAAASNRSVAKEAESGDGAAEGRTGDAPAQPETPAGDAVETPF